MNLSALTRAEASAQPRTYRVEFHPDLRPGFDLHWRLYAYGPGHWCIGGYAAFKSETEAHGCGRKWLREGRTA